MSKIQESVTENCHVQRKGNENQYKHSAEVISNVKEARSILGNSDMYTQKVVAAKERKYLNVSVLYVQERQMMIKLAESPELGWKVAQEYQRNPINSEDEKVMNRALSKAERKTKFEMAKMRPSTTPYSNERWANDDARKYKPGRCFPYG
jgi:predicted phosphohydrolase